MYILYIKRGRGAMEEGLGLKRAEANSGRNVLIFDRV